jgi:multiple sugar transport system substrate-binding protein
MDSRKRATMAAATGVAFVLAATGCSSGGGGEATDFSSSATGAVDAWAFDNADDVGEARVAYAADALPDLDVSLDQTTFDAQKFTTRVASGDVPDVVQMDRNFVATYAAQGLIQPLDACYAAHDVDPDERFYESVADDVAYDDQTWGVPQFFQPPAVIVDRRVLEEAGLTTDDIDTSDPDRLVAAVEAMYQESDGDPTRLGFDGVWASQAALFILGQGGQIVDGDGKPTLDDPRNLAGLELEKRLADAQGGYAAGKSFSDTFDTFGDRNQFVADQVGAQIAAQWYVSVLSPYRDQVDITAVPFRDAEGDAFAVAGGTAYVVPVGAENPDGACAWALTLTDQAIRDQYVTTSGDEGFDETIATYYDAVSSGTTVGASPAGQQIQSDLQNAVASYLLGDKTAEEALADAQRSSLRAYERAVR